MAVQDVIYTGELKIAQMVLANTNALINGALKVNWLPAKRATRGVLCVQNQLNIGDTSSANFLKAYTCLQAFIGQFGAGAIDPNAQNPGTTINITNVVAFNQAKLTFSNVTSFTLANYNTVYAPFYGNNPILAVVLDSLFGDYQDIPVYTYATPGDSSSAITAITYTFAESVSGYLSISGPQQASGGTSSSGGSIPYTFNQSVLIFDGTDWYMPLPLPTNMNPIFVKSNGVEVTGTVYDTTYSPARLYGFANNSAQTIIVNVI